MHTQNHNLIPLLAKDAGILTQDPQALIVFMYLLSNCEVVEGETRCLFTASHLQQTFTSDQLKRVSDCQVAKFSGRRFILGEDNQLYANTVNPFLKEVTLLEKFFKPLTSTRKASVATDVWHTLHTEYLNNSSNIKNGSALSTIFKSVYLLVYCEEFPRTFTLKEMGQFNILFKLYGAINSVKILVAYISEAKNPSISYLLAAKDTYYEKATGVKKQSSSHGERGYVDADTF